MKPMYLHDIEDNPNAQGEYANTIAAMKKSGSTVPQIMHLLAFKPEATNHLSAFTHAVMRGPSPLSAGLRELIAAFTSKLNHCLF